MAESSVESSQSRRGGKSAEAFRTISEVARELDLPQHVLRFWETKFPQVKPLKRGGGRRYYRPEDLVLLQRIRDLLYTDGYTIRGVQKLLRENGAKGLVNGSNGTGTHGGADSTSAAADTVTPEERPDEGGVLDRQRRQELADILKELESIRDRLKRL